MGTTVCNAMGNQPAAETGTIPATEQAAMDADVTSTNNMALVSTDSNQIVADLFRLLDTNEDGELDKEEMRTIHGSDKQLAAFFDKWDSDKNTALDENEWKAYWTDFHERKPKAAGIQLGSWKRKVLNQLTALEAAAAEPIAEAVPEPGAGEEVAEAKETQHDVSVAEDDAIGELFRLLDSNQNGVLDREELRKVFGSDVQLSAFFEKWDHDKSRGVDQSEWKAYWADWESKHASAAGITLGSWLRLATGDETAPLPWFQGEPRRIPAKPWFRGHVHVKTQESQVETQEPQVTTQESQVTTQEPDAARDAIPMSKDGRSGCNNCSACTIS